MKRICGELRLALAWMTVLVSASSGLQAGGNTNVVLFLADDLGWTGLGSFGSDLYETPNLDRLAAEGMKFTNAYAACTVCSPTRASIMTGMYPARLHLTSFIPGQDRPFAKMQTPKWTKGLEKRHTTLPEALKPGGYRTIHVGKWHLNFPDENAAASPLDHGFDFTQDKPPGTKGYYLSEKSMQALGMESNYVTDYLADVASEQIRASKASPFFLYFAFHVPHTPIQGRADLVAEFEGKVDSKATHRNPTYAAMVKSMDMAVGKVLATLEAEGLSEQTIILFTSDNGGLTQRYGVHDEFTENLPLRRGKGSAYEGGVRVPGIVKWPGITQAGSVCDEPVVTTDLYPTVLEVCRAAGDVGHNASVDGVSWVPLLRDASASLDRDLFWHFPHYHAGGDGPYSAIRSGDLKLIERHEGRVLELYDLSEDVGESINLANERVDDAAKLKGRLDAWRNRVGSQPMTPNPDFDPERALELKKRSKKK